MKESQLELLRRIVAERAVPIAEIDGRVMRPLCRLGLVVSRGGTAVPTPEGRDVVAERAPQDLVRGRLKRSAAQDDLLRMVVAQNGIPAYGADRRTVRALKALGLVTEADGRILATSAGLTESDDAAGANRSHRRGRALRNPRAVAIESAVDRLERLIPPGSEVLVGPILAGAVDVTAGFRAYARKLRGRGV